MLSLAARFLFVTFFSIGTFSVQAQEYDWQISGTSGWTKSPYTARAGAEIIIAAFGQVQHSWISGWHGPDGNSSAFCQNCKLESSCNVAALLVRFGQSDKVYCVGNLISGPSPASGSIYFAINDSVLSDNQGSFSIKIGGPGVSVGGGSFGGETSGRKF